MTQKENNEHPIEGRLKYFEHFSLYTGSSKPKQEKILERALDIRKFEIELYWKRATYFWTLISILFAGKIGFHDSTKPEYIFLISCIGFILSLSWYLVNRGSKYWQENWERHVDALEDEIIGPLYKTTLNYSKCQRYNLLKSYPFSVSKINQIISLYITFIWAGLFLHDCFLAISPILETSERLNFFSWCIFTGLVLLPFVLFGLTMLSDRYHLIKNIKNIIKSRFKDTLKLPQCISKTFKRHKNFFICILIVDILTISIYLKTSSLQYFFTQYESCLKLFALIFLFLGTIFCSIYLLFGTGGTSQEAKTRKLDFIHTPTEKK